MCKSFFNLNRKNKKKNKKFMFFRLKVRSYT